jgi:hypothetical protein
MIVVDMFKVGAILPEQKQQVCVVTYKMFWYFRVRLTQIETVLGMSTHRKVLSYRILLIAGYIVKDEYRMVFGSSSLGGTMVQLSENVK